MKLHLYQAICTMTEDYDELYFVSDGTRKPIEEEARDVFRAENGYDLADDSPVDVYRLTGGATYYDYTARKMYKITLRKV
jgi:hypothetical protein